MKWKSILVLAGTLCAIASVAALLAPAWVGMDRRESMVPVRADDRPRIEFRDARFKISEHGRPQWQFSAGRLQRSADGRTVALIGLRNGIYYQNGHPYLHFHSASVTYDTFSRQVGMDGGVDVQGPRGMRFTAPSLRYDSDHHSIVCPGPVQFVTSSGRVTASGSLRGDLKRETFNLQNVSGEFELNQPFPSAPL